MIHAWHVNRKEPSKLEGRIACVERAVAVSLYEYQRVVAVGHVTSAKTASPFCFPACIESLIDPSATIPPAGFTTIPAWSLVSPLPGVHALVWREEGFKLFAKSVDNPGCQKHRAI